MLNEQKLASPKESATVENIYAKSIYLIILLKNRKDRSQTMQTHVCTCACVCTCPIKLIVAPRQALNRN